jgi:3-deoxy-manno-octulosonate cytidylyltransferase (CMP-KDO synthetase)
LRTLGIIPARYQSSRLPGKPLALIAEKPMIQHVYERSLSAFDLLVVATDDQRVFDAVEGFGGKVVMTSNEHSTGTNRCLEAYQIVHKEAGDFDVIVNIQGDEPMILVSELNSLIELFKNPDAEIGTLVKVITTEKELSNSSGCFVTITNYQKALYFSRTLIPFLRNVPRADWLGAHNFYKHIGLYAYRPESLKKFALMEMSSLEIAESLEQNRWLENGGSISVGFATEESLSVDTPEDLAEVKAIMESS